MVGLDAVLDEVDLFTPISKVICKSSLLLTAGVSPSESAVVVVVDRGSGTGFSFTGLLPGAVELGGSEATLGGGGRAGGTFECESMSPSGMVACVSGSTMVAPSAGACSWSFVLGFGTGDSPPLATALRVGVASPFSVVGSLGG